MAHSFTLRSRWLSVLALVVSTLPLAYGYLLAVDTDELFALSYLTSTSSSISHLLFTGALVMGAGISFLYFERYVIPTYKTKPLYQKIYRITFTSQLLTAIIPISDKTTFISYLHLIVAIILGVSMGALMIGLPYLAQRPVAPDLRARPMIIAVVLVVIINALYLLITRNFLLTQMLGITVFFYWYLRVAFSNYPFSN